MTSLPISLVALAIFSFALLSSAIMLDVNDPHSIRAAAAIAAQGVQGIYNGNQLGSVLGKFPYPPYYWWESGGAWGGMISYWHYTGDASYNHVTLQALVSQLGPAYDFNVPSEAFDEGNDDQAFWAFAAMSAAEYGFPSPPTPAPTWVQICINTWIDFVSRWDMGSCNGGLKWQFHHENAGYDYKSAITQGGFFQISARLARYTGNNTYLAWAEKIWEWTAGIGMIDNLYNVYDGSDDTINCSRLDHDQWSYNVGVFLYGAAVLQNYTNGSSLWVERTAGLLDATSSFVSPFPNATNVLYEPKCETTFSCDVDQWSMKGFLALWLSATSLMAPFTAGRVAEILQASAIGASYACTSGPFGNSCSNQWYINGSFGENGLGQELSAMEVMYSLLVNETTPPATLGNNITVQSQPLPPSNTSFFRPQLTPSATRRPTPLQSAPKSAGWKVEASLAWLVLMASLWTAVETV